jgi:hypothetical protein
MIKSRRMGWSGHVACIGAKMNAYRILMRKQEGKRPLRTPRRKLEDNLKMDLTEIAYEYGWINLAQDRDE